MRFFLSLPGTGRSIEPHSDDGEYLKRGEQRQKTVEYDRESRR